MTELDEKLTELEVIKRNGRKVAWNGTKIAVAIKKGFDSITENEDYKYSEEDVNKVYNAVTKRIEKEYAENGKIKIETIQDLIEEELKKQGYEDVYKSFSEYRERRNVSRQVFFGEKKQHKFLKSIEGLGLKSAFDGGREPHLRQTRTVGTAADNSQFRGASQTGHSLAGVL